ncbi:MAG: hypothetical protein ACR2JB_23950 [Bryobacteraceae bacterium]
MESCGYVGLCKAALNYQPGRCAFPTYAHLLIRGAIIDDYLRKQQPVMFSVANLTLDESAIMGRTQDQGDRWICTTIPEPCDKSPSVEDILIEQQEQRRKCRHLSFAGLRVSAIEFRCASKKHMNGETLREIGAAEGRSASWAHYRVHCGERQLREALLETCAE